MKQIAAAVLLALTVVSGAQADTVSYSNSFSSLTDVTGQAINVDQFDPTLGNLVSATFELSASMDSYFHAVNDGDFYAWWDKQTYTLGLVGAAPYSGIAVNADGSGQVFLGTGTSGGAIAYQHITNAPSPWNSPTHTISASNTFTPVALGDFIGTGDLSFLLTTVNWDAFSAAGLQTSGVPSPAPFGLTTEVTANVKVTYGYTAAIPVPEADSYALLVLGMGLVGLLARRRKA